MQLCAGAAASAPPDFRRLDAASVAREIAPSLAQSQAAFSSFKRRSGKPNGSSFAAALPVGLPGMDHPRNTTASQFGNVALS